MNLKAIDHSLKVGEVSTLILPRCGGLLKSKLVRNPNQWIKIFNYGIDYVKDKIVKKKINDLKKELLKKWFKYHLMLSKT